MIVNASIMVESDVGMAKINVLSCSCGASSDFAETVQGDAATDKPSHTAQNGRVTASLE